MSKNRISLGDPFPLVPLSHFVQVRDVPMGMAWQLVGPTVRANQDRSYQELLCIAFVEGMRMALHAAEDTGEKK